jgi:AraC-like DNA-binding protein
MLASGASALPAILGRVGDLPVDVAASRQELQQGPLAYLRGVRMERAHRDLQGAEPGDGVAWQHWLLSGGFTHLGRFAVDYRRRFGMYPSQTLRS